MVFISIGFCWGDESPGVYSLSLKEASRLAIENSFDIQLLKFDTWLARARKGLTTSIYDTILNGEVKYRDDQSRKTSTIFGSKTVDNDYNAGLTKKLPTGTTVGVDLANNRNATNSSFVTQPVTHDSSLGVSITQSLGSNFFGIQDRGEVNITHSEIEQSEYTSLDRMEEFLASVEKAYWELALFVEKKVIQEQIVVQAQKLWDSQREKFNDGIIEKAELIASESNYKIRVNELKIMTSQLASRANILRLMLNISDESAQIVPKDTLTSPSVLPEVAETIKTALGNRWDFKSLKADAKARKIRFSVSKSSLWPQIDLKASLRRNGLGDHFNHSIENISDTDNLDFSTSIMVNFPLENTKAGAQFKQSKLDQARSLVELKKLERKIVLEVTDQWRDCQVLFEVAQSQDAVALLQTQKFEEESKRFNFGRSSIDQIIRFQEDVLNARHRAIEARKDFLNAVIELQRRQGVLLKPYLSEDFLKETK